MRSSQSCFGGGGAARTCMANIPPATCVAVELVAHFVRLPLAARRPVPTIADMRSQNDPPDPSPAGRFIDDEIEVLRADLPRGRFRSVLFDFDGTLSLIREGWPQVMIPMMVEVLRATGTTEDAAALTAAVEDFVMRLNGRQTIYQMIQLAEEVERRGGRPAEPLAYKRLYH